MDQKIEPLPFCECGKCGLRVTKPGNRFINGHNLQGKNNVGVNNPMYGVMQSPEILKKKGRTISKVHLTEKEPLPDGWKSKVLTTNEKCSVYFGNIGEQIVSEMYPDVQVMPAQSPGYDIIYNGNKIDIKSAFTGDKNSSWRFYIKKNTTADHFLCLAFNNREDHTLVQAWLIPGEGINHLKNITIRKETIHKWSRYEQPINELLKTFKVFKPKPL